MTYRQILIIEDEFASASAIAAVSRQLNCEATLCYSGETGLSKLAVGSYSLVLLDLGLPDMSGIQVLEKIRKHQPQLPVVIITAHANLENALAAKKLGAAAYLIKPLDVDTLRNTLRSLLDAVPLAQVLPAESSTLVGSSTAMQRAFVQIADACISDAPVLISGPTGSGKTLAARTIHENSRRKEGPFVVLHCSSVPESLLESELFGHEKNAFTGANTARIGHLERASGGTLFLDEIGDISPAVQAKILRFVEERKFTRVGGREELHVNLRLITATHRDLRAETASRNFREDLYYRLHVLEVIMPPLVERREDIPQLVHLFLGSDRQIASETIDILQGNSWPGNVRQLRNAVERAAASAGQSMILPHHLPDELQTIDPGPGEDLDLESFIRGWLRENVKPGVDYATLQDKIEAAILRGLLEMYENKPTVLARIMNINRVTLRSKCRRLLSAGGD